MPTSSPEPPANVAHTLIPFVFILTMNASLAPPPYLVWKAPLDTGNVPPSVKPVMKMFPPPSAAIPQNAMRPLPASFSTPLPP